MRQIYPISDDKPKKVKYILILLGLVIAGGVASLFMNGGGKEKKQEMEEFEFVELAPPPPPPPPPVPDEPEPEPEPLEELTEPLEIPEESEISADEPVNNVGIDLGDMAAGIGGGAGDFFVTAGVGRRGSGLGGDDQDDGLGDSADSAEPATPTFKTQPLYPSALLKNKIGGKVVIAAVVDAAGVVVRCTIKTSSGQPELDKSAVTAVQKWKFKPGTRGGKPVQSTCLIPYTFKVEKS